ncbi:MAG TPA: CheR family methyltransferase [Kofleriaceae bacterium]
MPSEREVGRFAAAVERQLGHVLGERRELAASVLARRAQRHREPVMVYVDRVARGDRDELREIASEIAVGETHFFRHHEQLAAYGDLLAAQVASRGVARVLSAGCSTGEEPYTLAMIARERVPDPDVVSIQAVDFDARALATARRGRYSAWSLRATSDERARTWFVPDGREFVLAAEIRGAVTFAEANLVTMAPSGPWDVIFCRNVLMYFGEAGARRAIENLVAALAPGGHLFLGYAETLRDRDYGVSLRESHGAFYYQRSVAAPVAITQRDEHPPVAGPREPVDVAAPATSALDPIHALVREERFAEARDAIGALDAQAAATGDATLLRALVAAQLGDAAGARSACEELLARTDRVPFARYLLALVEADPVRSEEHARAALAADPTFAMAAVHVALACKRQRTATPDDFTRAITLLERDSAERVAMFAGGFTRDALIEMCRAELGSLR